MRRAGGDFRWLSWTAVSREGLVYAVGRDVTDEKTAAEMLREAQETLNQTLKMETIGQLTGGVAHDFNNLLAAILSNLDLARKRARDDPDLARLIEGAIQGAERGAALTGRLLAFARRQELKTEAVDVAAMIQTMKDLLARSLGPTVTLDFRIDADAPPALADAHQLELAVLNLAVNARDAMPAGGLLTIALDAETIEPPARQGLASARQGLASTRQALAPGRYARLTITDTGVGMDQETLDRALEPFFTTKGVGQGTGLGLPMVQGLMAQLGGALRLESAPGRGTTVTLHLPAVEGLAARPAEPTADEARPGASRIDPLRVLVVDDDPLVALGTAAMLEDLGHAVVQAQSAEQALSRIEQGSDVEVVITDHARPGMSGVDLAERLARLRPDLPVILSSGYAEIDGAGLAQRLPRLPKPFRQADLVRSLTEALSRRRP
jgi:signal transduction histidine kinase